MMLASFEKTTHILFDGARKGRRDTIDGVSECIIVGTPIPIGTGMFKLLKQTNAPPSRLPQRSTLMQSHFTVS
jgi:DNA-directed RNA polymerase III subunit RPC1